MNGREQGIVIDESLLAELELFPLRGDAPNRILRAIYTTLELRVGFRLASAMNDAQLDQFDEIIARSDEATGLEWLQRFYPEYQSVVREELDLIKSTLKAVIAAEKAEWLIHDDDDGGAGDVGIDN